MTELRMRAIRDMELAGLGKKTQKEYVRAIRDLAAHYNLSPDQLTEQQVEEHLLYVRDQRGAARGTFGVLVCAVRFFYRNTVGYDWLLLKKRSACHAGSGSPTRAAMTTAAD
jgi:integrase/recombinase XerD